MQFLKKKVALNVFFFKQKTVSLIHTRFRRQMSVLLYFFSISARFFGSKSYWFFHLLKSRRVYSHRMVEEIIRKEMLCGNNIVKQRVQEAHSALTEKELSVLVKRIIVLRPPHTTSDRVSEKGVLLIKFSETCRTLYAGLDVKLLAEFFKIVLEPSWSGYSTEEILCWCGLSPEPVVVMSPEHEDREFLTRLRLNLVPSALGASDWVDPRQFFPIPGTTKKYDAVMVANYTASKRVDRYIKAVKFIARTQPFFKGALVCARMGDAKPHVTQYYHNSGVASNLELFETLPRREINLLFNRSRCNVLTSLREGANKTLFEGMFADIPALLIRENIGVNKKHINRSTGILSNDRDLEKSLLWLSAHAHEFEPRRWAEQMISPYVSASTLRRDIYADSVIADTPSLMVKVNSPELNYFDARNKWILDSRYSLLKIFQNGSGEKEDVRHICSEIKALYCDGVWYDQDGIAHHGV